MEEGCGCHEFYNAEIIEEGTQLYADLAEFKWSGGDLAPHELPAGYAIQCAAALLQGVILEMPVVPRTLALCVFLLAVADQLLSPSGENLCPHHKAGRPELVLPIRKGN